MKKILILIPLFIIGCNNKKEDSTPIEYYEVITNDRLGNTITQFWDTKESYELYVENELKRMETEDMINEITLFENEYEDINKEELDSLNKSLFILKCYSDSIKKIHMKK